MAVDISSIVVVNITTLASVASRVGFGTPLVFGFHDKFLARAISVASVTELASYGFDANDPEYKLVSAIFAQDPSPPTVIVGRSSLTPTYTVQVTPVAQNSTLYTVVVEGASASYQSDASATVAEITAGLKSAIDFLGKNVRVLDNTTDISLVPRAAVVSGAQGTGFGLLTGETLVIETIDSAGTSTDTVTFAGGENTAAAVAAIINTQLPAVTALASAVTDPITGAIKVRLELEDPGFRAPNRSIRIVSGTANAKLLFPTDLQETQSAFAFQNATLKLANSGGVSLLQAKDITSDPGDLGAELAAIQAENDDWFMVIPTIGSKSIIDNGTSDLMSAVIASGDKMLMFTTMDHSVLTNVDDGVGDANVAKRLFTANQAQAIVLWSANPLAYPDGAWAGAQLPKDPGSTTWMFKTLTGIVADDLSSAQLAALDANNVNRYVEIAGISMMEKGLTSKPNFFIDMEHFVFFLKRRIQEAVFTRATQLEKIPFTDPGAAIVENEIRAVLQLGVRVGGLASDPAPSVSAPRVADVTLADRANRILPDIKFSATLAGAIHKFTIQGTLTV